MSELNIQFLSSLLEIPSDQWNALNHTGNPFLKYEFLLALETSGSVSAATGWQPSHLTARNKDQQLVAVMPSYIKQHSYGEYVFDWSWADAYSHYGLNYYPKLLSAIPFTPSVGPRLLAGPIEPQRDTAQLMFDAVRAYADKKSLSSWHLLFPDPPSLAALNDNHLMVRQGCQFQWRNQAENETADTMFTSFDHFLNQMTSRKRKNIKKERLQVSNQSIRFVHFEGKEITQEALGQFYLFYHATYLKRGQQGYLNQSFFQQITDSMPDNLLLVMAEKEGAFVAGALFLKDHETLYGRYWGCLEDYKQLHFETCYYQGIDYCITHQLKRFDAGAQGEHKIQRGFKPIPTYSLHWVKNKDFQAPINDFIHRETVQVNEYMDDARQYLPFKTLSD
ncbi:GNAT family N-acetyltransferase [Alkalimarinus alittae]|uniref:GNAT family N-acetyltransferase n=1 Tax=Alkalimarinus alittae TaxID=2961619 RepID=A0ABY6N1W5_9ALTE|nr:GNAT family N-acetyltransferase [Alkalimarinus alittae]UZE96015.1 GNAT family N-acetyltransferase [Alkalimarinus alittae]